MVQRHVHKPTGKLGSISDVGESKRSAGGGRALQPGAGRKPAGSEPRLTSVSFHSH